MIVPTPTPVLQSTKPSTEPAITPAKRYDPYFGVDASEDFKPATGDGFGPTNDPFEI